jgi:hypothetical protein
MFHVSLAATVDMAVLPGVLGSNTLRLPAGTPVFTVSRQQYMKQPGQRLLLRNLGVSSGLEQLSG